MKYIFFCAVCLISIASNGQEPKAEFDGHKWEAPYNLPHPKDWGIERFLVPVSFAPEIRYSGVEDIRFTPGWAKPTSEEYWTYAFLWYLNGAVQMDEKTLTKNLKSYYSGLYKANTGDTTNDTSSVITSVIKVKAEPGDLQTYKGTVQMMDYMQKKPILLHCIVHYRYCSKDKKTLLFHELSPKPFTHSNWIKLNQLWIGFKCEKANHIAD